jgi:hypothetical protein
MDITNPNPLPNPNSRLPITMEGHVYLIEFDFLSFFIQYLRISQPNNWNKYCCQLATVYYATSQTTSGCL